MKGITSNKLPLPIDINVSLWTNAVLDPTISEKPKFTNNVPSVAITELIPTTATRNPFMAPITTPTRIPIRKTNGIGMGKPRSKRLATTTAVVPTVDPTERSIFPVRTTKVRPIATNPIRDILENIA
jgi:hypothetical protein